MNDLFCTVPDRRVCGLAADLLYSITRRRCRRLRLSSHTHIKNILVCRGKDA
jgi:hypothetical protein